MTERMRRFRTSVVAAAVAAACGQAAAPGGGSSSPTGIGSPTPSGSSSEGRTIPIPPAKGAYRVEVDPANFVSTVDNPYFPLVPGTTLVYVGTAAGEREVDTVTVTDRTKEILGVPCVVVRDEVKVAGELRELTFDWYTQDVDGNVWYFGEDSKEYEHGQVSSTVGSWEAGVDGAQPGVIMLATPEVGTSYRQELYLGEAEDRARVVALGERVSVPYGSFDDAMVTEDFTPLEPMFLERKYYAPGIGVVLERLVEGGDDVSRLIDVRRAG